jgi:hypothetical protein
MKVDQYIPDADGNPKEVTCAIDGVEVNVRHSDDGTCLVVSIKGAVSLEPRKGSIWLVVKPAL